ncbi:hypothetical protein GOP47_0030950, partial [Adiantum capillus-veneris]
MLQQRHTKASEFAAIVEEDSPSLNLSCSSPTIDFKQQEEVSILESFTKCSSTKLVGKSVREKCLARMMASRNALSVGYDQTGQDST